MKKFLKGCLIVAGGLCIVGILMIIVCSVFGGRQLFAQALENNEFSLGSLGYHTNLGTVSLDWEDDWLDFDEEWEDDSHDYINARERTPIGTREQVKNLELKIGAAQLEIMESEDDQYWLQSNTDKGIKCYIEEATLELKGVKKIGNHNDKVYLYVPAGVHLNDIDVELGAGRLTAEKIECEELDIAIGAGQIQLSDMNVDNLELEVAAGQIAYKGAVKKEIKVECAAGNANLMLQGDKADWDYDVECAAGQIMLEDTQYNSLLNDINIENNTGKYCKLECAMGQIQVNFYQE